MKVNARREMIKKCIFDMSKYHYGGTGPNNKHKNRTRRTKAMLKATWNREVRRQFNEEISEILNK